MRRLRLYIPNSSSLTRLTVSHMTDDILGLCKISESEDLTEQSTFNSVASPGQNRFGTQTAPTLKSSVSTLQVDCGK